MYKILFFVPVSSAEIVKMAMFAAGAGKLGNYDQCSFETLGTGQFRPLAGSKAFIGKVGELERVEELKVEMLCDPECLRPAILALKNNHPYEMPAYDIIELIDSF